MKKMRTIKAQSTLEYTVLVVCLVAALLAMQIYLKRSMQGRFKQSADSMGQQYAPDNTTSDITMSQDSYTETTATVTYDEASGKSTTTTESFSTQTEKNYGYETVGNF